MMRTEVTKMGKRGTLVIPSLFRQQFGLHEGDLVIAENHGDGILIRPAVALPVENYSLERQAEFLLSNAIDAADYKAAVKAVKKLGLDPAAISHHKPSDV